MSDNVVNVVEKPNSVELKASAKGDVSFNVKSYGKTLTEACEEAKVVFESLKEEYGK